MPIYEYQALSSHASCEFCRYGFEMLQQIADKPISKCPDCGQPVKKIISWCHSAIMETSQEHAGVERKIKDYEKSGMWSHAAELADTHSEKVKDKSLKLRALDNYKKAGYKSDMLEKHTKLKEDK
jgi:putative FmdB family regulatory protein